jgi:integrase
VRIRTRPIRIDELKRMVAACPPTLIGLRDRCVLLLGFGAALTRTEIVTLRVEDLERTSHGLIVRVGAHAIGIPTPSDPVLCPQAAIDAWLEASGIVSGEIIRALGAGGKVRGPKLPERDAGKLVARTIRRAAQRAGMDPRLLCSHSLRAGLVSLANDENILAMQRHGRWRRRANVRRYLGGRHGNDEGQGDQKTEKSQGEGREHEEKEDAAR